jgi:hypothetical protein
MTISKEEARQALLDIDSTMRSTRLAIANGCASPMLILWGCIWIAGYTANQFLGPRSGIAWMCLSTIGALFSIRLRRPTKNPNGPKIGIFWFALFAYSVMWAWLLFGPRPGTSNLANVNRMSAYFATIPMFAYVVGGQWFGRFFTILGLSVTALTFLGLWLVPNWFQLWMAVMGGGSLIGSGVYIRRFWK